METDARTVTARMLLERTLVRVERLDPAASGRARLDSLALARLRQHRQLSDVEYAERLESLSASLAAGLAALEAPVPESPEGLERGPLSGR